LSGTFSFRIGPVEAMLYTTLQICSKTAYSTYKTWYMMYHVD